MVPPGRDPGDRARRRGHAGRRRHRNRQARPAAAPAGLSPPFSAQLSGTLTESGPDGRGISTVTIDTSLTGGAAGELRLVLQGPTTAGGGVRMTASTAGLGPPGQPTEYQGRITTVNGTSMVADVQDASGRAVRLAVRLSIAGLSGLRRRCRRPRAAVAEMTATPGADAAGDTAAGPDAAPAAAGAAGDLAGRPPRALRPPAGRRRRPDRRGRAQRPAGPGRRRLSDRRQAGRGRRPPAGRSSWPTAPRANRPAPRTRRCWRPRPTWSSTAPCWRPRRSAPARS